MAIKKRDRGEIKFWTPLRVVSTLIMFALLAAFGVSSCNSNDSATIGPPAPIKPATSTSGAAEAALPAVPAVVFDTAMKSVNGEPIKLANYSGKVLVVNLWATWCGPCRNEIPELVRLYHEYQDRGLEMVGLSTEDPDASAQSVQEFVRKYNVDYRVGWVTRDVAIALMQGRSSIPQSFIITRDGRIKKRFIGFHPVDTPPLLKKAIEEALVDNG